MLPRGDWWSRTANDVANIYLVNVTDISRFDISVRMRKSKGATCKLSRRVWFVGVRNDGLYGEFFEWPKYKLQGPLWKQSELTKQLKTEKKLATIVPEMIN